MLSVRVPVLVLAVAVAGPWPAVAGERFDECRTEDGLFVIASGVLRSVTDSTRTAIPFERDRETVLSERSGYCVSGGQRYPFEARTSRATVRFRWNNQPMTATVLCEVASDDLPIKARCEREVITVERSNERPGAGPAPGPKPPRPSDDPAQDQRAPVDRPAGDGVSAGGPRWLHNGSVMRLEARGAERRFVYERPRQGLAAVGVGAGAVLFEGRREGAGYRGTAVVFSRTCGPTPFAVAGTVSADERTVELVGDTPLMGPDCRPRATRRDVLVFTLAE